MKTLAICSTAVCLLTMASTAPDAQRATPAQTVTLTPQIGLGTLEQASPDATFEIRTLGQLAGVKDRQAFGGETYLLRKDRGPHSGQYAALVTAPAAKGRQIMGFGRVVPSLDQYQLVGADGLGPLPSVDLVAVHYIKVRPDRRAAFDRFVAEKLNPAAGHLRSDLRFLYYKSVAGPHSGGYITVVAITRASRDKYWPNGSDSDDLKAAFTPSVKALATELQTYLVDGSFGVGMTAAVFESKEWADWGIVGLPR